MPDTDSLMRRALFGSLPSIPPLPEHELVVVGIIRDRDASLRLVDLATSTTQCEGRAAIGFVKVGARDESEIENAVMRPVCRQLAADVCAKVEGPVEPLNDDVVADVIAASARNANACFKAGLAKPPKLAGRVVVSFTIDELGTVRDVTTSKFPDEQVTLHRRRSVEAPVSSL